MRYRKEMSSVWNPNLIRSSETCVSIIRPTNPIPTRKKGIEKSGWAHGNRAEEKLHGESKQEESTKNTD